MRRVPVNSVVRKSVMFSNVIVDIEMRSNGNWNEWSPIRSVIMRVMTKSDDRARKSDLFISSMITNCPIKKRTQREVKNTPKIFFRLVMNSFASLRPKSLSATITKKAIVSYLM